MTTGIQYSTEVIQLPSSLAVAHLTGDRLVVDSILTTAVRTAALPGQHDTSGNESVYSMEFDSDSDSDDDGGEGNATAATGSLGKKKAKGGGRGGRGASRGGVTVKKKARGARKPRATGTKKKAGATLQKSKGAPKKK